LRFYNINIEGPDCSGKTTLFQRLHKKTSFKYNIHDRSYMSMYVYSKLYGRDDASFWYDKILQDLKNLNTLYIVLLPPEEVILERLKKRGDEFQDEKSIINVINIFKNILDEGLKNYPNVKVIDSTNANLVIATSFEFIEELNSMSTQTLIKNLVHMSLKNELVDITVKEKINRENIDYSVLTFPKEEIYYKNILLKLDEKINNELKGINEYKTIQKVDSRRFIYTDDSCISVIHALWRENELNVYVLFRSSNVEDTFWADFEFIKIAAVSISKHLSLPSDCNINLNINLRSCHIIA